MIIVSTREFREKQGKYLDMVVNGEDIIVKSRDKGSFKLLPVTEDDMIVRKEHILSPDADLARAITMDELLVGVKEDLRKIFRKGNK